MIKKSEFKPAWWLANSHLQTIWATVTRRNPLIALQQERLELPDGDFIDLSWTKTSTTIPGRPLILILHGLGGCLDSPYAKAILTAINDRGWQGVFMHYRGCSGVPNRLPRSYHSGETQDADFVINECLRRWPKRKIAVIGYSLGGNILLKWLGETKQDNSLTAAVAISVPFELKKAANRMLQGFSQIYQWYILRELRQMITSKFKIVKAPIRIDHIHELRTFWEFDTHVTAPLHGFADAHDYYARSSSRQYLKHICTPTLIVHAVDDPFMTPDVIPSENELSDSILLELSDYGGHVGFITGNIPGRAEYWLEQRIIDYLDTHF